VTDQQSPLDSGERPREREARHGSGHPGQPGGSGARAVRDLPPWPDGPGVDNASAMVHSGCRAAPGEITRLGRAECLRLLASVLVGRLIFTVNALPTVRPMNFALADGRIVLRTTAHSTATRKIDQAIVAFEVDELDAANSSGWSVIVVGPAEVVKDAEMITRYKAVPLVPWAPGVRDQFVTITTELVEGLRVRRDPGNAGGSRAS
jgi:uncharacterized protein